MCANQEMLAHHRLGAQLSLARRNVFTRKAGRSRSSSATLCGLCDFHMKAHSSLNVSLAKEG